MIKARCPNCSKILRADPAQIYRCPHCQQRFHFAPEFQSTPRHHQPQDSLQIRPPIFSSPSEMPLAELRTQSLVDDPNSLATKQPLARPPRTRRSAIPLWPFLVAAVVSVLLVCVGVSLFLAFGTNEPRSLAQILGDPLEKPVIDEPLIENPLVDKPQPVIPADKSKPVQNDQAKEDVDHGNAAEVASKTPEDETLIPPEPPKNEVPILDPGPPAKNPLAQIPLHAEGLAKATKEAKEFFRAAMAIGDEIKKVGLGSPDEIAALRSKYRALQGKYGYSDFKAQQILGMGMANSWPY